MPSVILTRPTQRLTAADNQFHTLLHGAGIDVIELPMIQIEYPSDTRDLDCVLARLGKKEFDYCVLSSPTAVDYFHTRVSDLGLLEAIQATVGFATVGEKSASKLREYGYKITLPLPPEGAGAAALLTGLRTYNIEGKKTLILQSQIGMPVLSRAFEMCKADITHEVLYETTGPSLHHAARLINLLEEEGELRPDMIAFFSPSAVQSFTKTIVEMNTQLRYALPPLAAIGETTAMDIRIFLHKDPAVIARKASQESLAADIISYFNDHSAQ